MKKMSIISLLGLILALPACDCCWNKQKTTPVEVEQAIEVQETDIIDPMTDTEGMVIEEEMPESMEDSK